MEINDIIKLMQAVKDNGLTGFKLEEDGFELSMKKEKEIIAVSATQPVSDVVLPQMVAGAGFAGAGSQADSDHTAPGAEAPVIDSDKIVASPLVGTFYNSATPDSEPFAKVGDTVKKGQTLGIIEAMKLMNEIECEYDGVIEAVLVGNEAVVEYGQPLFRIR